MKNRWGLSEMEWQSAKEEIRAILISIARSEQPPIFYCPLRGMGEKPSPSGEDFSRPAGPERDRPDLIEAPAAVASNLSGTRGVFRAAAKVEFIRLSEKPPKPPPSGGWSLHSDLVGQVATVQLPYYIDPLFHLLGEISEEESDAGHGMLSALVVTKDEGLPGSGFFALGEGLGFDVSDPEEFWCNQIKEVYNYWSKH